MSCKAEIGRRERDGALESGLRDGGRGGQCPVDVCWRGREALERLSLVPARSSRGNGAAAGSEVEKMRAGRTEQTGDQRCVCLCVWCAVREQGRSKCSPCRIERGQSDWD